MDIFDAVFRCVACKATWPTREVRYRCTCGGTLDVESPLPAKLDTSTFDARLASRNPLNRSGVWRFRELIGPLPAPYVVTHGEGNTNLYRSPRLERWTGAQRLHLKHEGENPTGSFKDRGMTAAISVARRLGMRAVACASTGNTSASMAAYAAMADMTAFVFIPAGQVAYGKLSQALAFGAKTLQIDGDFDDAMRLVQDLCADRGIYLVNSVNPFRIEGQKAIGIELMQDLAWRPPDWIVLPGGNLGNSAALYKGLSELHAAQLIPHIPRIAVIQAHGANPMYTAFHAQQPLQPVQAKTLATAIQIGAPVSFDKSLRGVLQTQGTVEEVTDQEILDAKAQVDAAGIGAEPASCATVAGIKKLIQRGVIDPDAHVCGILTGHVLKDPDAVIRYHKGELPGIQSRYANAPLHAPAALDDLRRLLDEAMGD